MNRIVLVAVLLFCTTHLSAQKLAIGERSPDIKVSQWIQSEPSGDNKARLVEFFHSSNKHCSTRLETLDNLGKKYQGKLDVILIAKESADKVKGMVGGSNAYYVGIDDSGRTFASFGVQFVPFSVLIDKKGRVVWSGNPSSLDGKIIESAL